MSKDSRSTRSDDRGVDGHSTHALALDVQDFAAVERVISLLRGRRYDVRRLQATSGSDGGWILERAVQADDSEFLGLHARLSRLVSVIELRVD